MNEKARRIQFPHFTVQQFAGEVLVEVFESKPWRLSVNIVIPVDDAEVFVAALAVAIRQANETIARGAASQERTRP